MIMHLTMDIGRDEGEEHGRPEDQQHHLREVLFQLHVDFSHRLLRISERYITGEQHVLKLTHNMLYKNPAYGRH